MNKTSEQAFENEIADILLASEYHRHFPQEFDRENANFSNEVLAFIQVAQPKVWEKLEVAHGDKTGDRVIATLCKTSYRPQIKSRSKGNS
jgi:type I restriction enzyme, R subunit